MLSQQNWNEMAYSLIYTEV